jgi:hypothetical protein
MSSMSDSTLYPAAAGQGEGRTARPMEIQAGKMDEALTLGRAWYLSETIRDFVRFKDAWWILDRDIWFLADDEELIASLDSAAELMRTMDAGVQQQRPR